VVGSGPPTVSRVTVLLRVLIIPVLVVATAAAASLAPTSAAVYDAASAVVDPVVPVLVPADGETVPVQHSGDAADEPTIWVNHANPAESLVIGNDKQGALEVYELNGSLRQRITTSTVFWGNSDIRQGVALAGRTRDVVVAYNAGLRVYEVDPVQRRLVSITDGTGSIFTDVGEGVCLYQDTAAGQLYAFVIRAGKGRVRQFRLGDSDDDGLVEGTQVRQFLVGTESEGCVVDDVTGALYISQEDVALWRYAAAPDGGTTRVAVDTLYPDGHLRNDIEGLALVDTGGGTGYLIASAQYIDLPNYSYFAVYDRQTNAYLSSFRIAKGTNADTCTRTDGIAAYAGDLGPSFPQGVFVCQDNGNRLPGTIGDQDFKLTRLDKILNLS